MGRVIRNQRKGRGSIFSTSTSQMCSQSSTDIVNQRPILVLTKRQRSSERSILRRDMATFAVLSRRSSMTQVEAHR